MNLIEAQNDYISKHKKCKYCEFCKIENRNFRHCNVKDKYFETDFRAKFCKYYKVKENNK